VANKPVWKPVKFDKKWKNLPTSQLDNILPSWETKRIELIEDPRKYEEFLNRLKRQHAIETGIIEKLYDLSRGVTETLIKDGFAENLISHGDSDKPAPILINFLNAHLDGINLVFDYVASKRELTISLILELHQLITRHQDYTTGINQFGNTQNVELKKGQFKTIPNNPRRMDGTLIEYCPPEQVGSEMDNLLNIYKDLEEKKVHPVVIAAWFHHCFTQIHPFQDGNGRMARLLSTLILIKHNLFPFTVNREERGEYITALEQADLENFQPLLDFFVNQQTQYAEYALNWSYRPEKNLELALDELKTRLEKREQSKIEARNELIVKNRNDIFEECREILHNIETKINKETQGFHAIYLKFASPIDENYFFFNYQIIQYAKYHNYYFNKNYPRGWISLNFKITPETIYRFVLTLHHYGYSDSAFAIGGFLEFIENESRENIKPDIIPLIKPLVLSLEKENIKSLKPQINEYIQHIVAVAVAQISQEL
jgi:Fic family protein